jgi:hypothetical protein
VVDNYDAVSKLTIDYFLRFHSLESVTEALVEHATETRCMYGQLLDAGMMNRGLAYSAFMSLRALRVRT